MKKILGFILGAGAGTIGTLIRTSVGLAAGYFVTKGFIDQTTASTLAEQLAGAALTLLAYIGSRLNDETPVK